MELKQGTLLQDDKYRIIRTLGQGGFGITYLAEQVLAGRQVCIKEFFPKEYYNRDEDSCNISLGSQGSREFMERFKEKFMKEAKTIARLDHPNIIHIFDVFKQNNTGYYVMEYIDGESLHDMVMRRGALAEDEAKAYILQLASALKYIHSKNITHLDVKPGNIMVRKDNNRAILIDFGLSKQYDDAGGQTSSTPVGISQGFAPMEQYTGGVSEFSPATDIYSMAATLYYLTTGMMPPKASDVAEDGLPALPTHLSEGVRRAIERGMESRKKDRPQSVDEFLQVLEGASASAAATQIAMPNEASAATPVAQPKQESTPKSEQTPVQPPKPEPKPAPRVEPKPVERPKTPTPAPPPTPRYNAPAQEPPKKRSGGGCLWIMIILLVIIGSAIGIGGWFIGEIQEKARIETEQQRIAEQKAQEEATRKAEQQRIEQQRIDNMVAQGLGRDGVYQVGDYYNRGGKQGVVFEVWNGGRNGKIVSLDEAEKEWCTKNQWYKGIVTGANSETDGKANTDMIMRRSDSSEYPAFVWCRNKGNDWYLPAKDELLAIDKAWGKISYTMSKCGGESIQGSIYSWYWTSTEYSDDEKLCAWFVIMRNGYTDGSNKHNDYYVRAVSAF